VLESYADWIMAVSSVVSIGVTSALVYYAYVTINESWKNRRKDTIENMLENLYSPLYETLRRVRYETSDFKAMVIGEWSRKQGRQGPRDCVFSEEQLAEVREIIERFGHYMDPVEQALLTKVLSNPDSIGAISTERLKQPQHLFLNVEIDPRFDYIKETRDTLRKQLEELTKGPRPKMFTTIQARSGSNEVVSDMPYKSRPERFDEVFRTLLVIATVLASIYLASIPRSFLVGFFKFTIWYLAAAIAIWAVAVLWGALPWANVARLLSIQVLSLYLAVSVWALSLVTSAAATDATVLSQVWPATIASNVISLTVAALSGLYLRLTKTQILLAVFLLGIMMAAGSWL
jgi:hypothetical protein